MKKKLFVKVTSMILAATILICSGVAAPVYAKETENDVAYSTEESNVSVAASGESLGLMGFSAAELHLPYGNAQPLKSSITLYHSSYQKLGKIYLPQNDGRIHRIIYKVQFMKDPYDQGNGDVRLKVDFRRNGVTIHHGEYDYEDLTNGIIQAEFNGVSAGQQIEVWADAATNPDYTSNGHWRKLYIFKFEVYTD